MARRRALARSSAGAPRSQQALRITGGEWRGRKLAFPVIDGLRPSLSQNRERLFNWLRYDLSGRRVLDAFAGSGILGLEALSRGAASVDFVERDAQAAKYIREHVQTLNRPGAVTTTAHVHQADLFGWLRQATGPYDLVFLDPPFAEQTFQQALDAVAAAPSVGPGALVYLETPVGFVPEWPEGWVSTKYSRKGRIEQHLWRTATTGPAQEAP